MTVPRVVGGNDCGELQVLDILEEAGQANLAKIVIFGCSEDGEIFRPNYAPYILEKMRGFR